MRDVMAKWASGSSFANAIRKTPTIHNLVCLDYMICNAPVAQWTRRLTTDQEIESSILSGGILLPNPARPRRRRRRRRQKLLVLETVVMRRWSASFCVFAFPAGARAIGRVGARRFDAAGVSNHDPCL